ncbi:MAG: glycosyltransferase family 2 protein [Rivularia sp. (in: Bacteria)]|nr:glycosyltransferase family 2 protein [Rivularia sp. MS3]
MNEIVILTVLLLIALIIFNGWLTFSFVFSLRKPQSNCLPDKLLPKTAVVLCLRGVDPFLSQCIEALLNLDYPDYELRIVVDSCQDPAWKMVNQLVKDYPDKKVKVSPLAFPLSTCSLKCSALVQAVSELNDDFKVVALVDGDTVVHANWLRELVTPLHDSQVGATTGNRWYLPQGKYWGTTIRYLWNVASVPQMYFYGICWGGSLAIKTEIFHQTELLQEWEKALCEDTMLFQILRVRGLRIKFVPSLMILNREECQLTSFFQWGKRQLLNTRLYHPFWWAIVCYSLVMNVLPIWAGMQLETAMLNRQWLDAFYLGSATTLNLASLPIFLIILEYQVRTVINTRGEKLPSFSISKVLKIVLVIPFAQIISTIALISSLNMKRVKWRGITYRINGPWDIRLIQYRPYKKIDKLAKLSVSL